MEIRLLYYDGYNKYIQIKLDNGKVFEYRLNEPKKYMRNTSFNSVGLIRFIDFSKLSYKKKEMIERW